MIALMCATSRMYARDSSREHCLSDISLNNNLYCIIRVPIYIVVWRIKWRCVCASDPLVFRRRIHSREALWVSTALGLESLGLYGSDLMATASPAYFLRQLICEHCQ